MLNQVQYYNRDATWQEIELLFFKWVISLKEIYQVLLNWSSVIMKTRLDGYAQLNLI